MDHHDQPTRPSQRKRSASGAWAGEPPGVRVLITGYQVLHELGRCRTGVTYRAVQLSLQREVALTVLAPELASRPGCTERFVAAARSAGAVHHPNVVACYDVGEDGGLVYQALELVPGDDLAAHLAARGGRLTAREAVGIVVECARGLEGIHRAGLMHGGLSLANVMVSADEAVKLANPARARADEAEPGGDPDQDALLAPEQAGGGAAPDIRSDTYALGAILFALVTGRAPFAAPDPRRLRLQILQAPPPDPRDAAPELSPALAAVVLKALAKDPARRYATPTQLREDLERLRIDATPIHALLPISGGGYQPGTRTVFAHTRPSALAAEARAIEAETVPAAPRARTALLGVAVAVLAVGVAGWGWLRSASPPAAAQVAPAPAAAAASASATQVAVPEPAWPRPAWAATRGEDAHGRWAELPVAGRAVRLRWCPPGSFLLGSQLDEAGRRADEGPCLATISHGFWLAEVEVAQGLYQAVMGANPSAFRGDDLPVENVTWDEAQGFLRRVNAALAQPLVRLPTEAEWEYACRAGAPGETPPVGWFAGNSGNRTHPVGTLPANAWGLYDLRGNVMEWCQDYHAPFPTGAVTDPLGWDGVGRIARGGAWGHPAAEARIALRTRYLAIAHFSFLGFRFAIGG